VQEAEEKDSNKNTKSDRDSSKSQEKNRSSGSRGNKKGKARQAKEESDSETSDNNSDGESESVSRIFDVMISKENAYLLDADGCVQTKKFSDRRWVIDGGATSHCTGNIRKFESLDKRYRGTLGTANKSLEIQGKGIVRICLSNSHTARLRDVLFVPGMRGNLLSTQILYSDGIYNTHDEKGYRFYRKYGKVLATGYNKGRTSYLRTVRSTDALMTKNLDSEKEFAYLAQEAVDMKILHQRFGHPGNRRMRRLAKKLRLEFSKGRPCEVCIQAKSVKRQNQILMPRAKRLLALVYVDFFGAHTNALEKRDITSR
jgi:hypothetical protein